MPGVAGGIDMGKGCDCLLSGGSRESTGFRADVTWTCEQGSSTLGTNADVNPDVEVGAGTRRLERGE